MKLFSILTLMVVSMASQVQAKRLAPSEIAPIEKNGRVFIQQFNQENGGFTQYLIAQNATDKSLIWKTPIYHKNYETNLEQDVQDIHLVSLSLVGKKLVAKDEKGQTYQVDASDGKLLSPSL